VLAGLNDSFRDFTLHLVRGLQFSLGF